MPFSLSLSKLFVREKDKDMPCHSVRTEPHGALHGPKYREGAHKPRFTAFMNDRTNIRG